MEKTRELLRRARELYRQERLTESEVLFRQVAGSSELVAEGLSGLGMIGLRRGDPKNAARFFQDSLRHNERCPDSHYGLGVIAESQNAREEAVSCYRRALALNARHAGATSRLKRLVNGLPSAEPAPAGSHPGVASSGHAQQTDRLEGPGALLREGHRRLTSVLPSRLLYAALLAVLGGVVATLGLHRESTGSLVALFFVTGVALAVWHAVREGGNWQSVPAGLILLPLVLTASGVARPPRNGIPAPVVLGVALASAAIVEAFLRSRLTRYQIYENRVDCAEGIIFRKHRSLWLFQITNAEYVRGPLMLLANSAVLRLTGQEATTLRTDTIEIVGLYNAREMKQLWDELRTTILKKRRAIKNYFI